MWCAHGRGIVTVAEKVSLPRCLSYLRCAKGLTEIIGVAKGESFSSTLIERVRGAALTRRFLADRYLARASRSLRHAAYLCQGPAALATSWSVPSSPASPTRMTRPGPMAACDALAPPSR